MRQILIAVLTLLAGTANSYSQEFATVSIPVTCMRTSPKHAAEQSSQAVLGTPMEIISQEGDWYQVRTPDNYTGYIRGNTLCAMSRKEADEWKSTERVVCRDWCARLYDKDGNPTGYAPYGSVFLRLGESADGFVPVGIGEMRYLIKTDDVWLTTREWLESTSSAGAAEVIATAYTMMGAPYLWGGTSSLAPDCSGFTQIAFKAAGMLLPRDTYMQVKCGEEVASLEDAVPGDLIFFGNNGRVNHVAIYLGNYRIIHSSGYVHVRALKSGDPEYKPYTDTILAIRRVLQTPSTVPGECSPGVPSIAESLFYFRNL